MSTLARAASIPASLYVAPTNSAAEREAEQVSRQVTSPTADHSSATLVHSAPADTVHRSAASENSGGTPVSPSVAGRIRSQQLGGSPLPESTRQLLEPRFGADFQRVRIHTGTESVQLNQQLMARAFTVGHHIFFGAGEYRPQEPAGRQLLAHELTHVIQQGGAEQHTGAIQRQAVATIAERTEPGVQRSALDGITDKIGEFAHALPGFRLLTMILGRNPITRQEVRRDPANLLRAAIEIIPGGGLITQALDNHGVLQRVGDWLAGQIAMFGAVAESFGSGIQRFLDSLSFGDLLRPGEVWERGKQMLAAPLANLKSKILSLVQTILGFIRDALLTPLAALARKTPAYDLLGAVLGRDPITQVEIPRTPETLIGGFMKLIDETEVWENMQKANVVPRAFAWFQNALQTIVAMVTRIPELFREGLRNLEAADLLTVPQAFLKVAAIFAGFAKSFIVWAGNSLWKLLEIIFDAVAPGVLVYLKQAGDSLRQILKNPLPFMGNLLAAVLQGFYGFRDNILTHLKNGMIGWLTGALTDVYLPKRLELKEIVRFVLSVLGLTWQNLRGKLVKVIGEPAMAGLEKGFALISTLIQEGPAAAWEQIKEDLQSLQESAISAIVGMVRETIILSALPKLLAMLIPGVGFLPMLKTIYDTCVAFVAKIKNMVMVVKSFLDSILLIAAGVVKPAATRIEQALAGSIPIVLSLLGALIGLGGVSEKIQQVLQKIRNPIDKAMDRVINWLVKKAQSWMPGGKNDGSDDKRSPEEKAKVLAVATKEAGELLNNQELDIDDTQEAILELKKKHRLKRVEFVRSDKTQYTENLKAILIINPQQGLSAKKDRGADADEAKPKFTTDQLGGDTVGVAMQIESLSYKSWNKGTTASGQDSLMALLPTQGDSEAKYVRGHLLNRLLGGKGEAENQFPITGYANGEHERKVESQLKDALRPKTRNRRIARFNYSVKVEIKKKNGLSLQLISGKTNSEKSKKNRFVNALLHCSFTRLDTKQSQSWTIPSIFNERSVANRTD